MATGNIRSLADSRTPGLISVSSPHQGRLVTGGDSAVMTVIPHTVVSNSHYRCSLVILLTIAPDLQQQNV